MYVLLKDTDNPLKGIYLKSCMYDREIEKYLIELYYRGAAEGLIEYSVDSLEGEETYEVYEISEWIERKIGEVDSAKALEILNKLKEKLLVQKESV